MKNKKILSVFFSTVIISFLFAMCSFTAFAADMSDNVSVIVSAEKSNFSSDEKAVFEVAVNNMSGYDIDDMKLDASISDNFVINENKNQKLSVGAYESKTYKITANPVNSTKNNSPKTGVAEPIGFAVILVISAIVAIKTGKPKKVFSFIIAAVMCGTVALSNFKFEASASVSDTKKLSAETDFNYNSKTGKLSVTAQYTYDNTISIDTSSFNGPNKLGFYSVDTLCDTLNGTLNDADKMSSFKYEITDSNNSVVLSGDIPVDSQWKAENFGLVMGSNLVKITAVEKDGTQHKVCVYIINSYYENMLRTNVDTNDNDNDGLINYYEEVIGSDPEKADSDDDGLTDFEEFANTATDPMKADTDGNGISDADEDPDNDGLSNKQEVQLGTNCFVSDTDDDKLSDGDEVNKYGTDPLKPDTDDDGLSDSQEIQLGYDPKAADTDSDGVEDSLEVSEQTKTLKVDSDAPQAISEVSVKLSVPGHIDNVVGITNTFNLDMRNTEVAGLVGSPFEFNSSADFDTAEITFKYDESQLGKTNENDLRMLWYDEANDNYVPLDAVLDTDKNTITYTTTHFSTYLIVDKPVWVDSMRAEINYRNTAQENITYYDMALVIDVSGSMQGTRISKAKTSLNAFIDSMLASDRAGIVKFASSATKILDLTSDTSGLKSKVNSLSASGGTYAMGGLSKGIEMLKASGSSNTPIVILVCDGDIYYDNNIVGEAIRNNIPVFCINVVNGSSTVMEQIANDTGGAYYYAATNDDIIKAVSQLKGDTVSSVDVTDTDGDGLYDVYEINGMKLSNGKVVYTDPNSANSAVSGATDSQAMGGTPTTETITIDGETFTSVLWHAPVYNTLSPNYIYVDGRRNSNGMVNNEKLNYKPYSNSYYNRNYVNPETSIYEGESRTVNGADGFYASFEDKLANKNWLDCLKFASIATLTTVLVAVIDTQAAYCVYEYISGEGGPYEGLLPGRATRDYIYATYTIGRNPFGTNTANEHLLDNMSDAVTAAKSVLNDYNTDVYIALAPEHTWTGCFYNSCCPELSWDYAEEAIQTLFNIPAFGIYNRADAGAVLHVTYDPSSQNYNLEFNYYLIDYYDFTLYDLLDEMNKLSLARSFELYGCTAGVSSWNKNDTGYLYWLI